MKYQTKNLAFSIKSTNDDDGSFQGYLSTYDVDKVKDAVVPGAYKKTLSEAYAMKSEENPYLYPILWQHQTEEPIGGFVEMEERKDGLWVVGQLDLDIEQGRRAYSGIKKGYLRAMSIGYRVLQDGMQKGSNVRLLKEIQLFEGSIVTMPANGAALVARNTVKAMDKTGRKAFGDEYRVAQIGHWMNADFYTLVGALKSALMDAFDIGDQPMEDLDNTILNDGPDGKGFLSALRAYVQEGIDLGVADYLDQQEQTEGPGASYYCSDDTELSAKAGATFSDKNKTAIVTHVKGAVGHLNELHKIVNGGDNIDMSTSGGLEDVAKHTEEEPVTKSEDEVVTPTDETETKESGLAAMQSLLLEVSTKDVNPFNDLLKLMTPSQKDI